jgi:hypothetical protein
MRVHLSRQVINLIYALRESGQPLREAIQAIKSNPDQPDASEVSGRPGRRELHVRVEQRGFWLQWEVKQDRGETVIEIILIEEN